MKLKWYIVALLHYIRDSPRWDNYLINKCPTNYCTHSKTFAIVGVFYRLAVSCRQAWSNGVLTYFLPSESSMGLLSHLAIGSALICIIGQRKQII